MSERIKFYNYAKNYLPKLVAQGRTQQLNVLQATLLERLSVQ